MKCHYRSDYYSFHTLQNPLKIENLMHKEGFTEQKYLVSLFII